MARRPASNVRRFAAFEVDLEAGELRKGGVKIHLQELPFRVLAAALERPGEVVTREELREKLWSADTFVEFEHSLNTAVNKLRAALNDSSDAPRYIETLPRRGYRFIGALEADGAVLQAQGAPGAERANRRWTAALWAAGATAVLTATAIGILYPWPVRSGRRDTVPEVLPLTTYGAKVESASFSPDGDRLVFSMCRKGDCSVFIKQIGIESPQLLVRDGQHPVWSPDGRYIVFRRILPGAKVGYFLIPPIGGRETKLAECEFTGLGPAPYAGWMPDSKRLILSMKNSPQDPWALFLFSLESRECQRLTSPKAHLGDGGPVVSPDGRSILFTRDTGTRPDLLRLDLTDQSLAEGEPRKVDSASRFSFDGAWTAGGREIIYCAGSGPGFLWRVAASGPARPERLVWAGEGVFGPVVSRQRSRLVFGRGSWREQIRRLDLPESPDKTEPPIEVTASIRGDLSPAYSPDGKRIAFLSDRAGGISTLWVCDSDGSNPAMLASVGGITPQWSPDGEWIAFFARVGGIYSLYRIRASGGAPQRLTPPGIPADNPSWSADGKWLYFQSTRSGKARIWKMPSGGGEAVQVSAVEGFIPRASPDGQFLYYVTASNAGGDSAPALDGGVRTDLWRIPVYGGKEERILGPIWDFNYALVPDGIYFTKAPETDGVFFLKFYDLTSKKSKTVAKFDSAPSWVISVSPDRRSILYSRFEVVGQDLMMVENFR